MKRYRSEPQRHGAQLRWRAASSQPGGEDAVPQMALIRREIERAQFRPEANHGAAKIGRMDAQIIDETARMTARQLLLARRPVAPVLEEEAFFLLLRRTIELVRRGQRHAQRVLEAPAKQQASDEFAALLGDGAEALIVEIVRHPLDR